ncbi:uncharacterized protein LOC129732485 [Wyeomyia smithii]|uniref:uncharacterized protein LOC129732485 n=1 Tax=Wyeomyia smithii TaxID=174621 RepID=UPI002467FAC4|nr:uncharacterized protein LOC129732485 [Wyeomyia smithii]
MLTLPKRKKTLGKGILKKQSNVDIKPKKIKDVNLRALPKSKNRDAKVLKEESEMLETKSNGSCTMPEEENGENINGSLHQFTEYNNSIEEIMTVFDSDIEAENSSENDDARNIENMTKKNQRLEGKKYKIKKSLR